MMLMTTTGAAVATITIMLLQLMFTIIWQHSQKTPHSADWLWPAVQDQANTVNIPPHLRAEIVLIYKSSIFRMLHFNQTMDEDQMKWQDTGNRFWCVQWFKQHTTTRLCSKIWTI